MHFLCSPFGSSGDVFPMIGLALQLQSLGHRVTLLANDYFQQPIQRAGLTYESFGTRDEFLALVEDDRLLDKFRSLPFLFQTAVLPYMRGHYEICRDHFRNDSETVVITNVFGVGARIAHDHVGLPLVTLHLQPSVIWSDIRPPRMPVLGGPAWVKRWAYRLGERFLIDPVVCPTVNAFRRELQLPPIRHVPRWWHSPQCVACLFPEWFARRQADWPQHVLQSDFPLWDVPDGPALPRAIDEFLQDGSRPWVFTPGSANAFGKKLFEAAVEACQQLRIRGILATQFPEQLPHNLPKEIVHLPFASFSQLLPRAAGLVHHGGVGSMSQAMAAGIPQVIVPMVHDQFDNADRVDKLAVGAELSRRRLNGRRLSDMIQSLEQSPAVDRQCRAVATKLQPRNGLHQMARLLTDFYTTHPGQALESRGSL